VFANLTSNATALAAVNSILATIPSNPMYKTYVNVSAQYNASAALKAVAAKLSKLNVKTGGCGVQSISRLSFAWNLQDNSL
jgi:Tfp pilus assembly protein PilE